MPICDSIVGDNPGALWHSARMKKVRPQAPLTPPLPSERSFGILFTILFALAAAYGVYAGWPTLRISVLAGLCAAMLAAGLFAPNVLRPFNRAWFLLGQLLEKIFRPIVLGMMFFLMITPVAFVIRIFGRDELRLKKRRVPSYWLERDPPGPEADSFKNQF